MLNGMARDFSWTVAGREYLKIYDRVRSARHAALRALETDASEHQRPVSE